jgi:hypothetical protein
LPACGQKFFLTLRVRLFQIQRLFYVIINLFNIFMAVKPGFVSPSKYGANPNFVRSGEMVTDEHGRIKPKLPDSYKADPFEPTPDQQGLIQTLVDYMT